MDGKTDAIRATGSEGSPATSSTPLTTGTRPPRAASTSWLRNTRAQRHRQRVATYRRMFSRYLPFTGWRLPIQVESAIGRFKRILGGPRYGVLAMSARSSALGIDFDRGIWRTSSLEALERRKFFSVSPGHVDEAYVDDSWADLSVGEAAAWSTAAGDEIPLVYGYDAFATIAEGVAATEEGGILNIAEGGYSEILTTLGKGLTVRAGGDGAAELSIDGLQLGWSDTLDFDLPGVSRHDRIVLNDGASVFDLGAARISVNESGDLPTDGSAVLGLITSERGVSVGPTGTVYDRTGRPLAEEAILSSSRLNFRFDGESGGFQGVFLTPVLPQTEVVVDGFLAGDLASRVSMTSQTLGSGGTIGTANVLPSLVYVYDAWTGSTIGETVTYGSISATFGTDAFATIGTGLAGVAVSGTVDVIAGSAGVYNEQLTISQDVTIVGIEPSAPVTDMGADEAAAVLDGAGLFGAGITVTGAGVDLTLRNIAFSNWLDGSILVQNGGSAVVENVTVNGDVSGVASVTRGMRVEAGSSLNVSKSIVRAGDNNYGANNGIQVTGAGAVFTLSNSSVSGSGSVNQVGVAVSGGTATVTNSFVTGNFYGILFSNASNGSVTGSYLAGNTQSAVRNSTSNSAVIDASTNWWGVTTEAAVLAKTSSTGGNRVDITPYLLDGTDTGNATAGFQGDYSQLAVTTLGPQVGSTGRIQEGVSSIANGSLTGIDRVLEVNTGNYTGATNVSQSLTLETAAFNLNSSLTFSAPSQVAEAANGGGTAITVLNGEPGNNLAVNANLAFVGNGTLSLTSGNGSIVGSGVISAGTLSLTSTNGSITASTDAASLLATAKGDITIGDAGDITFTGVTSSTGNVALTAVGILATSGSVTATVGDVSLTGATLALASTTTAGDSLALEATAGDVNLIVANLSFGQDLSVTASGAITQDGALTVSGNTTLSAGSGINLMEANVFAGTVAINSVGDVALNDSTPLAFAPSTITGNLAVTAGGAITEQYFGNAQVLQITGTTSLSAGSAHDITLDEANDFGGAVSILSGKNVSLNDTGAIDLGASAISGNLAVTANGSITDSGVLNVTGTTTLNAGSANDITLDEANVFGGTVSVLAGKNVSLNDTGALDLGPSTISGNLFQVTAAGAITDSGNLSVSGSTELTAGSGNDITLDNANDFIGSVSVVSGKDVTLVDTSAIDLAASTISGNLAVTAGGDITDSGALNVAGATTLAAGTITPSDTAAWTNGPTAGTVDGVGIGASGGTAELGDFASPDYAPALGAPQSYLDYAANETITLTFDAPVTQVDLYLYSWRGTGSSGGPSEYTFTTDGTSALAIQSGLTGASTTDLTLTSASGFMNGVLRVTGTFTTLTITPGTVSSTSLQGFTLTAVAAPVNGPYDIVLDDANDFGGAFNVTSAANVTVSDTDELTLGAVTAAGGVTATAAASLNVATSVAGRTVSLTAAEINLPGSITASNAATLNATGGSISGAGLVTAGTVTANATGLIDLQTDATLFAGTAGSDLTVTDAGSISLNGVAAAAGNVSVTSNGSITVQSAVTAGQDVTLNASLGSISGVGLVTADQVTADAASSLSLNLAANSLDATSAEGNVVVTDSGDLTLGTVAAPGDETSVTVTATGNLTVATSVAANDSVSLRGASLQLDGTTTAGTTATLNATAGSIQGDGLVTANAITVSATGDAILNVSAQSITATTGSDFGVSAASAIDLTGLTVGGNATIAANGSITDSGNLSVNGTTTLTAGSANNITLDAANDFGGTVSVVSGKNVTLNDTGAIDLGASTISGNLAVTSGGSITSSGVVSAVGVNATAAGSIDLNLAAASLDATANGSITVTELDAITLGNVTSTAGSIDVTAGGPLTVGSNGTVSANQSLTLTGSTLTFSGTTISGSDITLNATAGDIDVGGLNLGGNLSATAAGELSVIGTLEAVGDITLTGANVAVGSGVTAGDDVFLSATAGTISGSGLVSADAVSATATGSIDLNLAAASLLASADGDITVVESDALTLDRVLSANGTARVTAGGDLTVGTKGVTAADVYLTGSNIAVDQSITSGSDVTLNATAGNISGSGLITGDLLTATATSGSVVMTTNVATVTGASNGSFSVTESSGLTLGNVSSVAGDVDVEAEGSLDINGSVSAGANVTLTSTNGSIAGPGSVSGALLTASAANGSIAVTTSVSSLTATANGSITLADTDSITLVGVTSNAGNVAVTAGGDIVVSSNVTSASDVLLNATAGNISGPALILADAVNATATGSIWLGLEEASLEATAGGDITVNDSGTTLLETVNSTGGNVTVISGGDLTVNGSVAAFTDVTLKGTRVTLTGTTTAGANATLQALGGDLSGPGLVTADAVFAEALDEARSINLNLATARLEARADRDITVANNGSLTLGLATGNGNLAMTVTGDLAIGPNDGSNAAVGMAGNATLNVTGGNISGPGTVQANGVNATATGSIDLVLEATSLAAAATGNITVADEGTLVLNAVTSTAGDVTVSSGALVVNGSTTAAGNDVTLTATTGNISGSGLISADTVNATAAGSIGLNLAAASLTANASSSITVTEADSLVLQTVTSTAGNVTVTAGGDLTVGTSVSAQVDLSLTGSNITLDGLTQGRDDITLNATAGGIVLRYVDAGDALTVVANGPITQEGSLSVNGLLTLSAGSANDIVLGSYDSNYLANVMVLSGRDVSVRSDSAIDLGGSTISGNLAVAANGSITDSGALLVLGTTSLDAGSSNDITLDDANDFGGAVSVSSGWNVSLNDTGAIDLGASTVSGNLTVTANGSITDSGNLAVAGTTSLTAGAANDITLDAANGFGGAVSVVSGRNVSLSDTGAIDLGDSTVSGNLTVTANGSITDSGNLAVAGTTSLTAGAANDITLDAANNFGGAVSVVSGRNVSLNDTGAIALGGSTISGNLTVTADGSITDSGNLSVSGTTSLTAGAANDITLNAANTFGGAVSVVSGKDVTLVDTDAIDLGASTVSGNLTVTANGSITDSGVLAITGATSLAAGATNDITLDALNDFVGAVSITNGRDVTLRDVDDIDFGASTISGNLSVTANGSITDSAAISVAGTTSLTSLGIVPGMTSLSLGLGSGFVGPVVLTGSASLGGVIAIRPRSLIPTPGITLDAANDFTGAVSTAAAGNVVINDVSAIVLGESTIGGSLTITADGAITDSGNLSITGTTSLTAGSANDITLDAANDFGGSVSVVSGNDVSLNDIGDIDLGASTVSGNLTITAKGSITDSDALTITGTTNLTSLGLIPTAPFVPTVIVLDAANDFGGAVSMIANGNAVLNDINSIDLGASTVLGNLTITANGAITDSGDLSISRTTSLTAGAANDITLDAANNFGDTVSVVSGNDVTLNDTGAIDLGASTVSGNLSVTAIGSITDSGNLSVNGTTTLSAGSASDITLDDANDFGGAVSVVSGNDVALNDTGAIVLGGSTISGNLAVTANGSITDSGALDVNGTTSLTAGGGNDITLDAANNFGGAVSVASGRNVTLNDTGAIDLGASTVSGNLTVTANGSITDSGNLSISGATSLSAGSANDITLDAANDFGGTVSVVSGKSVTLNDTGAIDLGGSTVSGPLNVTANGSITDSGSLNVTGITSVAAGPANDITLDAANEFDGAVRVVSGRNVTLNDVSAIDLSKSTISGNLTVTANGSITDSGDLTISGTTSLAAGAANDITLDRLNNFSGAVSVISGNNVLLNDSGAIDLGALTVSGNLTITANGNITDSGALNVAGTTSLKASSKYNIALDAANDFVGAVSVVSGRNVTLNDTGAIDLGGSTISGNLTVTANGSITDSGNLSIAGTTTLTAGTGFVPYDITLDEANDFGGAVAILNAIDVTLNDTNAITLAASTLGNNLTVTANGSITGSGPLAVGEATFLTAGASNNISLEAANLFSGPVSVVSGNNVALVDADTLILGNSTISGNLAVTSNGTLNQVSGSALTVAGSTSLTAGSGSAIALTRANNFGGPVSVISGKNVSLNDTGAIDLGASTVSGSLTVTANGSITDSGALAIDGTTSLSAGAANDITLDAANNFIAAVSVVSGRNVTLNDTGSIDLGASTISGNLVVTANDTITDSGAVNVSGTTSLRAGAANDITLDNDNDFGGAVSVVSGRDVALVDTGALDLGASTISGNLTVTSNGPITDSGDLFVSGITTLDAGAGNDVTLDNANQFGGPVSVASGRNVTLNDTSGIDIGPVLISGNLTVTANGAITDSDNLTVNGSTSLTAGSGNDITLNEYNDFGGPVSVVSGNNVAINDFGAIDLGASSVSGNLTVTANGAITDSGNLSVAGTTSLTAGAANDITLDAANDFSGAVSVVSGQDVLLNDVGAIDLGASTVSGNLTITANGSITDSGVLAVVGATSLAAGATNDITLDQANIYSGPVSVVSGNNVTLVADSGLNLAASTISGSLSVTTAGDATLEVGGAVGVGTGATLTAGRIVVIETLTAAGNVALNATGGNISGSGLVSADVVNATAAESIELNLAAASLDATANGSITVTEADALTLGNVASANGSVGILAGELTVNGTVNANISASLEAGAGNITGPGSVVSPSVLLFGFNGAIDLDTTAATLTARGGYGVAINNNGSLVLNKAESVYGNVSVAANGSLTAVQVLAGDIAALTATGNLTVDANGTVFAGYDLMLTGGNIAIDGSVADGGAGVITLNATAGSISGAGLVEGEAVNAAATGAITLNLAATSLSASAAGDVVVSEADDLVLHAVSSTLGNVSVTAGGYLTVASSGTVSANGSAFLQGVDVVLDGSTTAGTNVALQAVGGNISGAGLVTAPEVAATALAGSIDLNLATGWIDAFADDDITATNNGSLALGMMTSNGSLTVGATGNLTQANSETITAVGNISLTGTTIVLNGTTNTSADVTLNATAGNINVAGLVTADAVNATATGSIGLNLAAASLTASGVGDITVTEANSITLETVSSTAGNVSVIAGDIAVNGSIAAVGHDVALNATTGDITGSGLVTADAVNAHAQCGSINLNLAAARLAVSSRNDIVVTEDDSISVTEIYSHVGNATVTAGGDLAVDGSAYANGDLSLVGSNITLNAVSEAGRDMTLNATAGGIVLQNLTIGSNLTVTASGPITQNGSLTVPSTTSLAAGSANDITLSAANDFGGAVSVLSASDVMLNDSGAIDLGASAISGNLAVTASGTITDSGALNVTGTTSLTAGGANDITLDDANDFGGAVSVISGNDVVINDTGAVDLGAMSVSGNLTVTADGSITESGNLSITGTTSLSAGSANDITLDAANDFSGAVSVVSGRDVSLNDTGSIDLGASTISGNLAVTANGTITDSGDLSITGTTTLTAGSSHDINLDAANDFGGAVSAVSGKNVSLNDTGAIDLGASTISGNLAVTAQGAITDSGALDVTGTTSLTAGSANDITLDGANDFGGAVSVVSAKDVVLNDTGAIDLGASTISGNLTVTAGGAISSSGTVTAGDVSATTSAEGISLTLTADSVTAAAPGSISISQVGNQSVTVTNINSTAGNITLSTDGTTAGQGMTIDTLVANGGAGRVTLSGGVEFLITNNTTYTQSDISAATLNLSAATLLGSIAAGYNPPVGLTYDIINTPATTTAFSNAANGVVFGNVAFAIDYAGNVTLTAGLPTLVYVDDLWAGSTPGQTVSSGSYTGTFGYNAFATISTGVTGVATTGFVGVIEGLYNESITVSRDVTIEGIEPAVPTTEMGAAAGTAMLDGTGLFTAAITASGVGIDLIVSNLQFSEWINGAVLIQSGAAATLTNVTVVGELAGVAASFGIRLQGAASSLTLDKSIISAGSSAGPNNGVQVTGGTFTMTNSSVTGSSASGQVGVAVTGGTAIVSNSFITGNFLGLTFSNTATGTLSGNDLTGNSAYAVRNGTVSSTINASGNWWGAITESGVLAKTFSTGSSGARVDISPYLLDGTDTGNATAGFQGDFSQLAVTTLGAQAGANAIQEGVDAIADGTLSGVNRILVVNSGTYSGATDVNQSLTLTTSAFTLTNNLTISADIQAAEVTGGGGTAITVNGAGNNLATNANLAFTGTGTLALKLGSGSIAGPGVISASALTLSAANGSINVASDAGTVTLTSLGDATIADVGAIDLAASTIGGNLAVTANGSITESGVLNITGSTSLAAGSANDITLDAANIFGGAVGVASGRNVVLNDTGAIDLAASTISGNLTVTANGAITDSGSLNVNGSTSLTAGSANDITLNNSNQFGGAVSVVSGKNVSLRDQAAIDLGGSTISGNLTVNACGSITDSGVVNVTGTTSLTATSFGSITLDAANIFGGAVSVVSAKDVTLNDTGAIDLGASTISGNLTVTANGSITDSGALNVTGTTSLTAGSGNDITLDNANNFVNAVSVVSGKDVTLNDTGAIDLGGSTISGNLAVTANGWIDRHSGGLNVTGTTSLAAGSANDITLDAANNFGGAVSVVSGKDVTLNDTGAIDLGASTVSGNLAVTANGSITDSGALNVAGTTSLTAGSSNDITLDDANVFGGVVSVASGKNVTLNDTISLTLGASAVSGNLALTTAGNVSQVGGLTVAGTTAITAGTAAGPIVYTLDLSNSGNDFGGAVSAAGATDVYLTDANAIVLGNIPAASLAVTALAGSITGSGPIVVSGGTTLAAGASDITLLGANDFRPMTVTSGRNVAINDVSAIQLNDMAVSGNLTLTTNGLVQSFGNLSITGTTTLTAGSANDITLNTANNFGGAVSITSGRNVTLNDTGAITLGASTISGNLAITAGGAIGDAGTVEAGNVSATTSAGGITLTLTADTVTASAPGSIDLSQVGNQSVTFSSINSTGGNVVLSTDGTTFGHGMTLDTLSAASNGTVTLSGGIEFMINNGTSYTQSDVPSGQVVLSGATLLVARNAAYYPTLGTQFTLIDSATPISGTFDGVAENGTVDATGVVLRANYTNDLTLTTTSSVPLVTSVYVNSTNWLPAFKSFLATSTQGSATLGYAIPTGTAATFNRNTPNQLNTLSWTNMNQISVSFSEDVVIAQADFALTGVNVATYAISGFSYGEVGGVWTATWTLGSNLGADKLMVNVPATVVARGGGLQLAGAWTQPTPSTAGSAMPSGGSPGTAFAFRVNSLPGDVNSNTAVTNQDLSIVRAAAGTTPGVGLYTIFKDVNGNGAVTNQDLSLVQARLATTLPAGEPVAYTFPSASSAAFDESAATSGVMTMDEARQAAWAALATDGIADTTAKKKSPFGGFGL